MQPDIQSSRYQENASWCVTRFLKNFRSTAGQNFSLKIVSPWADAFSLRVGSAPPSVQIRKFPRGGEHRGSQRIRELIESKKTHTLASGVLVPENFPSSFAVARESDLTRECIIVTLADTTVETILNNNLLSPPQAAELLHCMKRAQPDAFVIFQRFLMGIEHADGVAVPFGLVEATDTKTLAYLTELADILGT